MNFFLSSSILDLDMPNYVSGNSAWIEHIPFALSLIKIMRPRVIVELGTHYGDSYFAFCQSLKDCSIDCKAYAVDTWMGDEHAGHYGDDVYRQVLGVNERHYNHFSRLIRSTFDEAADGFPAGTIDLLHIDGLHSYEAVRHDFETWQHLLSDKSVVLFHDTNVRERGFGVWKLWEELKDQYPSFEFEHGHGLGVLAVGANIDQSVLEMFEWMRNRPLDVKKFYSFLGGRLSQTTNLQTHSQNLAQICEDRLQHIRNLQTSETTLVQRIEELNTKLKHNERLLQEAVARSQELEAENQISQQRIREQDERLSEILNSTLWKATHLLRKYGR